MVSNQPRRKIPACGNVTTRVRCKGNVKIDLRKIGYKGVEWISVALDRDLWWVEHGNEPSGSV